MINSYTKKNFFYYWLPLFIYAAFIFFLSSIPVRTNFDVPNLDKVFHAGEYAIFGILLFRAIHKSFPQARQINYYFWIILISCLYGLSDEAHQLFVPNREFSFVDIFMDSLGSAIGGRLYGFRLNYGGD